MSFERKLTPRYQTYIVIFGGLYIFFMLLFFSDVQSNQQRNKPDVILQHEDVYPPMKMTMGPVDPTPAPRVVTDKPRYQGFRDIGPIPELDVEVRSVNVIKSTSHDEPCIGVKTGMEYKFFELISGILYVFSAYWDNRPNDFDNKHNGSYVRIISVLRWAGIKPQIVCKFHMESGRSHMSLAHYYEMCENHGRPFGGFIISCPVPNEIMGQPCSIEIGEDRSSVSYTMRVLPLHPKKETKKFGICVPPIYGNIESARLVEFIELSKSLGAQTIMFYDYKISDESAKVLEYYQAAGTAVIIPWLYPKELAKFSWYHGQMVAIQDCLYRNMHTTDYVIFNDIDEYLVPLKHTDWGNMVAALFSPPQCAHCYNSAFFPPKIARNNTLVMTSTRRTTYYSATRTKCMVKPYQLFELGIHHVSKPIWANLQVAKMAPNIGFIHHYRLCMRDFAMNCKHYVDDYSIYKFSNDITDNIKQVVWEL